MCCNKARHSEHRSRKLENTGAGRGEQNKSNQTGTQSDPHYYSYIAQKHSVKSTDYLLQAYYAKCEEWSLVQGYPQANRALVMQIKSQKLPALIPIINEDCTTLGRSIRS